MDPANMHDNDTPTVIYSEYESEPAIAEILGVFTDSLTAMIADMRSAMQGGDDRRLTSLAHQLKGAGGGYGYPMLTAVAAQLEQAAKEQDWEIAAAYVAKIESLCAAVLRGRNSRTGGQS